MLTSKITAFVTSWTHRSTQRRQVKGVVCASSIINTDLLTRERDFKIIITREDNQQIMISFNENHASYVRDCFDRYLKAPRQGYTMLSPAALPEVHDFENPYNNGAD